MRQLFRILILAALGGLGACYPPTTDHPVGTVSGQKPDPLLVGLWHVAGKDGERGAYFHFLPRMDGTLTILMVQDGNEPDGDWTVATATTAAPGGNRIMNVRLQFSDGHADNHDPRRGTLPLLYRTDSRGHLALFLMDEEATKAAIKSGAIKGEVEPGQNGDARITADPPALDAFMGSKQGAVLFSASFMSLTKME